jgi:hypothetical protein
VSVPWETTRSISYQEGCKALSMQGFAPLVEVPGTDFCNPTPGPLIYSSKRTFATGTCVGFEASKERGRKIEARSGLVGTQTWRRGVGT